MVQLLFELLDLCLQVAPFHFDQGLLAFEVGLRGLILTGQPLRVLNFLAEPAFCGAVGLDS